ncbi:MAG: DUF998 domain-containing protein [Bacteroidota bacterium]
MEQQHLLANLALYSGILSLLCLLSLHFASPEYKMSWRMISEYALGKHKWLLTLFFSFWAMSSVSLALLLWDIVPDKWAVFGVLLVFISGIGAFMGGLFDVKHQLHGFSFLLGIPTLPIGALLISYHIIDLPGWSAHQNSMLLAAHLPWLSMVLMAVSMKLLFSGFKKAGLPMGPNAEPPKVLPAGIIGINGYANRLLVLCYIGWLIFIAKTYLSL